MISLQFAAEDGLSSDLIKYFEHGAFSHVDAVLPNGDLLGARLDGGVQVRKPGYAAFSRTLRVDLPADDLTAQRFYAFLQSQVGKPYDMGVIAAFAFDANWQASGEWICSGMLSLTNPPQ